MKRIVFVLIASCFFPTLKAQNFLGFSGGITTNLLNTNIENRASSSIKKSIGYTTNFQYEFRVNSKIGIKSGISLIQKNYTITRTDSFSAIFEKHINTYLQVPILLSFSPVSRKKISFSIQAGIYLGYWGWGKITGKIPNIFSATATTNPLGNTTETFHLSSYIEKYPFDNQRDNRFELGLECGAEIAYNIKKSNSFFWAYNFFESLTDQQKLYMINQVPKYNRSDVFTFGYKFRLTSLKVFAK